MRISDWSSDECSSDLDQRHEMKGVGSGGGFVFTERVDYTKPGDTWIPIPLVAVFEVNERGKIFAWREYLDGGNVARKIGIEVNQQIGRASCRERVCQYV